MRADRSISLWILMCLLLFAVIALILIGLRYSSEHTVDRSMEKEHVAQGPTTSTSSAWSDARLLTNFECGYAPNVKKIGATHWTIDFNQGPEFWFCFRLEGVKNSDVRIDFKNIVPSKWRTLNPLYSYDSSIDSLEEMPRFDGPISGDTVQTKNGSLIPITTSQKWHFITNAWTEQEQDLCIEQHFEQDQVYVAMKYPHTPIGLFQRLNNLVASSSILRLIEIGKSAEGRALQLIAIGDEHPGPNKPTLIVYAGEHPDEHDTGWAAEGAIEFLISNSSEAKLLRERCNFFIIPMLDPDGTAATKHTNVIFTFTPKHTSPESVAYATFFKKWIDEGGRLDLVLNLHNVESKEAPHFVLAQIDPARVETSKAINSFLIEEAHKLGFQTTSKERQIGSSPGRLAGWLLEHFGAIPLPYEVNSQEPHRHLSNAELKRLGVFLVEASAHFVSSDRGTNLRGEAQTVLNARNEFARKEGQNISNIGNALEAEEHLKGMERLQNGFSPIKSK